LLGLTRIQKRVNKKRKPQSRGTVWDSKNYAPGERHIRSGGEKPRYQLVWEGKTNKYMERNVSGGGDWGRAGVI